MLGEGGMVSVQQGEAGPLESKPRCEGPMCKAFVHRLSLGCGGVEAWETLGWVALGRHMGSSHQDHGVRPSSRISEAIA